MGNILDGPSSSAQGHRPVQGSCASGAAILIEGCAGRRRIGRDLGRQQRERGSERKRRAGIGLRRGQERLAPKRRIIGRARSQRTTAGRQLLVWLRLATLASHFMDAAVIVGAEEAAPTEKLKMSNAETESELVISSNKPVAADPTEIVCDPAAPFFREVTVNPVLPLTLKTACRFDSVAASSAIDQMFPGGATALNYNTKPVTFMPSIWGKHFHDLRDTGVTLLYEAVKGDKALLASISGHSLATIDAIIDKHYFVRNARMSRDAGGMLEELILRIGYTG